MVKDVPGEENIHPTSALQGNAQLEEGVLDGRRSEEALLPGAGDSLQQGPVAAVPGKWEDDHRGEISVLRVDFCGGEKSKKQKSLVQYTQTAVYISRR